jgi:sec-independent protein translocase protein TatB
MFGVSGAELMVVLLVGLIVLGPDRLPVVARKAGQVLGDLRRMSSGFEAEMRTALFEAEQPDRYRRPSTPVETTEANESTESPDPGSDASGNRADGAAPDHAPRPSPPDEPSRPAS